MRLAHSSGVSRRTARWLREAVAGLDEDWRLVLLGVAVLFVTVGLAVLAAWTVHQRDVALRDATVAGHRLDVGGLDYNLYQTLITMQQDEVTLFQDRVDPGQATSGQDPRTDLVRVESDLAALGAQFGGSPRVKRDISLISRELARYTSLAATAQADNKQGLPVGAAYLREASGYLTSYTLPTADDIRQVDQAEVSADDSAAGAVPWPLLAVAVIGLACLLSVQNVLARYTHCQFDGWLLLSTAATLIVIVWSVTALSVSLDEVGTDTSPHAAEAAALAAALVGSVQAHNDDLLTLADHGEDCSAVNPPGTDIFRVTCTFEAQVEDWLTVPGGRLRADLAVAAMDAPDQLARAQIGTASAAADNWRTAETELPTLQNVAADAKKKAAGSYPRYDGSFEQTLIPYMQPDTAGNAAADGALVYRDFGQFHQAIQRAISYEWESYDQQADGASGTLGWAVPGAVLFGLLAAAAGCTGIALRVAEYWSAGRQPA